MPRHGDGGWVVVIITTVTISKSPHNINHPTSSRGVGGVFVCNPFPVTVTLVVLL